MTFTDDNPAPRLHTRDCRDWCNHCALCGVGILWGARCTEHLGIYPGRSWLTPTTKETEQ